MFNMCTDMYIDQDQRQYSSLKKYKSIKININKINIWTSRNAEM